MSIKPAEVQKSFPVLQNNADLVYLDSAASSLTPQSVIRKLKEYYENYPVNIHRGVYQLSQLATQEYEHTRNEVAAFIGAGTHEEVVFTRGTTESLNLLAASFARTLKTDDEIVTTISEHHANIVPWQEVAKQTGATLKFVDVDAEGKLILEGKAASKEALSLADALTQDTKVVTFAHIANVFGTINPVKDMVEMVHTKSPDAVTVVDAAQSVPHMPVDVYDLGADFVAFSAHKILGPTGVGVLWGRREKLADLYPYQFGGDMIKEVSTKGTTFADAPQKFEAGTPDIASVIALKEAIFFLRDLDMAKVQKHVRELTKYAVERVGKVAEVVGSKDNDRLGSVAFVVEGVHPHDVAQILDEHNIAVRAGHHCAEPLHKRFGLSATTRASFSVYNDASDIDKLVAGIEVVKKTFSS